MAENQEDGGSNQNQVVKVIVLKLITLGSRKARKDKDVEFSPDDAPFQIK